MGREVKSTRSNLQRARSAIAAAVRTGGDVDKARRGLSVAQIEERVMWVADNAQVALTAGDVEEVHAIVDLELGQRGQDDEYL